MGHGDQHACLKTSKVEEWPILGEIKEINKVRLDRI